MRLSVLFSLLFSVQIILAQNKLVNSENVLQWQDGYSLRVEDFQKPRKANDSYSHTAYKIEFYPSEVLVDANDYIQGYEDLTVVAEFHKDKSHFDPDYEAEYLPFEQLTFDIAELYARKIRKRFEELKEKKERRFSMYNYEYGLLWKACLEYQSEFSKATNHGWESKNEISEWRNKINQELKELQEYTIKPL
ncbi:hypothetical protein [Hanstruepera marina]|uniref:hypothetical protein n=1 Tax=Hanstruepera marina TaxID=2873265 RepID=UPI001CA6D003|nr:hypothetical protein [Hanstruepera marina]